MGGGYRVLHQQQGHPLASRNGGLHEHRAVLYDKIGPGQHTCYHCGKVVTWQTDNAAERLHVDHLDDDKLNNDPSNLEPSCFSCNIHRTRSSRTHCPSGHPRTPENTYTAPSTGYRQCRICNRERSRRNREQARGA